MPCSQGPSMLAGNFQDSGVCLYTVTCGELKVIGPGWRASFHLNVWEGELGLTVHVLIQVEYSL